VSATEWWSAGMAMLMAGTITFGVFAVVGAIMMRRVALAHHLKPAAGTLERINVRRDRFWRIFGSYTYAVDGRSYRGTRVGLEFDSYDTADQVDAAAAGLAPGPVTVWYDPRRPRFAVLNRKPPDRFGVIRWGLPIASVVAVVGIVVALTHWHAAFSGP
jgi:hypothetical protein